MRFSGLVVRPPAKATNPGNWLPPFRGVHTYEWGAGVALLCAGQATSQRNPYCVFIATFAAIDFETALEDRNSACAVGLYIVDDNESTLEDS